MVTAVDGGQTVIGQAARVHEDYWGQGVWALLREAQLVWGKKQFPGIKELIITSRSWKQVPHLRPNLDTMWNIRATRVRVPGCNL